MLSKEDLNDLLCVNIAVPSCSFALATMHSIKEKKGAAKPVHDILIACSCLRDFL